MLSVLLWKEYREHRMVWLVLAVVSAAAVLCVTLQLQAGWLGDPSNGHEAQQAVAVFLVGVYALICGAMLLAGERENGTLPFLDALPGWRGRLWLGKLLSGLVLVLAQIIFLMSLLAAAFLFANWKEAGWTLGVMTLAGLFGLSWGILFSSWGRGVMNTILLSFAGYMALGFVGGIATAIFVGLVSVIFGAAPMDPGPFIIGFYIIGFYAIIIPAALFGSAFVFTRLDRRRLRAVPEAVRVHRRILHPTWPMLFWLTWRQARGFAMGIAIFALLLGFITLLQGLILWPAATLIVGVLCGATAFADEQDGSFRFLGDQRLPLGRLWVVKVGVRFGVAVVAALLILAPSFITALANISASQWNNPSRGYHFFAHVFHSNILEELCPPGLFLTLWLVYGFCSGCLFGLLFRHGLAAGVFALFTCSLAAALWIPSLLGGGLHAWQVFGPPALILIATRLLMRSWAAGRIASWATAVRLTPFVVLAGLWIAGGLWYRVLEIPNVPERIDLDAFRASLPTPEQDEGGRLFRSACLHFHDLRRTLEEQQTPQGGAAGMLLPGAAPAVPGLAAPGVVGAAADEHPPALQPIERAFKALDHGWPTDDPVLAVWLDKMYAGEWPALLKKATELPTSPFDDVRDMTVSTVLLAAQHSRELAVLLAVRGLQRQAAGDDEAYIENLRTGLALSRSLRDRTPTMDVILGRVVEGALVMGLDRWLEKLHGRPDLIRQALALLSRHLGETGDDLKDEEVMDDLTTKNTAENMLPFLQMYLGNEQGFQNQSPLWVREEAVWVATAWLVPWERARQDRILRVLFERDHDKGIQGWLWDHRGELGPLPQLGPYHTYLRLTQRGLCAARAMLLKLALRGYQADNGKPAEKLDVLVPKYLPSIPLDPYDGELFRYRLSAGEEIVWPADPNAAPEPAPTTRKIPPGQGVLWSVGEDKRDDGGHRQFSPSNGETAPGEDLIYLVPLPPKAK